MGGGGDAPIRGSLVEQVKGVVGSKHAAAHHRLSLEVLESLVRIAIGAEVAISVGPGAIWPAKWLSSARRAAWGQGHVAVCAAIDEGLGATAGLNSLATVADDILVNIAAFAVVGLALSAGCAEEALLAFTTATNTRRIVRVVDTTQVASDLTAATGDTGLIDTLVLGIQR